MVTSQRTRGVPKTHPGVHPSADCTPALRQGQEVTCRVLNVLAGRVFGQPAKL